jgi:hypothetical protein
MAASSSIGAVKRQGPAQRRGGGKRQVQDIEIVKVFHLEAIDAQIIVGCIAFSGYANPNWFRHGNSYLKIVERMKEAGCN